MHSRPQPTDRTRWPELAVVKCVTLLFGLPALLHLMLSLSQARYGGWPAICVTLVVGIGLSISYHRRPLGQLPVPGVEAEDSAWLQA